MTGKIIAKCENIEYTVYKQIYITLNNNGYYYFIGIRNDNNIETKKFNYVADAYDYLSKELESSQYLPFNC